MKAIKIFTISALSSIILFYGCDADEENFETTVTQKFIRFSVLVENDQILEYPSPPTSNREGFEIDSFENKGVKTLKIPVALTQIPTDELISAQFSASTDNLQEGVDFSISPNNRTLNFQGEQLIDTIYVQPLRIIEQEGSIKLKIESVSNPEINIGYPNTIKPLDEFVITTGENIILPYFFSTENQTIAGQMGESFTFRVEFPQGYLSTDVDPNNLFATSNSFDYSLELISSANDYFEYEFTLNENLLENVDYSEVFTLNPIAGYTSTAPESLIVVKGNPTIQNVSTNFFDVSNTFYRLFGERWNFDTNDNICEWRSWNVFTVPVPVTPNGAFDLNGDGYHDQRIGFVSPNAPLGTNPFDVRRIFNGESINSPGLNIEQALEFVPDELENGQISTTSGTLVIIPSSLTLTRSADDVNFNIPISGGGTYEIIDATTNLWEIRFSITYDMTEINQAPQTHEYVLYNSNSYVDPQPITADCYEAVDL